MVCVTSQALVVLGVLPYFAAVGGGAILRWCSLQMVNAEGKPRVEACKENDPAYVWEFKKIE